MRDARVERGFSFAVGLIATLAMRPSISKPSPAVVTTRVPLLVPVAVARPSPLLVPEAIAIAAPAPVLACPTPPRADDAPIGAPITAADADGFYDGGDTRTEIAASARAPVIALRTPDGRVRVSDDDGRHFAAAFAGDVASSIAVDDRGRVYASVAAEQLDVRDERGRERRIPSPYTCEHDVCAERVAAAGDVVVWMHGAALRTSRDGGRHWRTLDDADASDLIGRPRVIALGGALYGIEHVDSDCGYSADQVARIDLATGASTSTTFSNDTGAPQLDVRDDAGATWRYAGARDLILGRVAPSVGGRVLFAHEHQLAELCGTRARAVSFAYGADRVDAVDAAGRPLIAIGLRVLRWSPRWGWRELDAQRVSPSDTP